MQVNIDFHIANADCLEFLATMKPDCVDAFVTDPPYELGDGRQASPARILAEVMFPKNAQAVADLPNECVLYDLALKIANLGSVGGVPGPTSAVPESAVTLDHKPPGRNCNVEDSDPVPCLGVANPDGCVDIETQLTVHEGSFTLKSTDVEAFINTLNRVGTSFFAGGLGVGFGVASFGFPGLQAGSSTVVDRNEVVGLFHDALAAGVGASSGAEDFPVPRVFTAGGSVGSLTARSALLLLSVFQEGGAQLVRTGPPASGLPAELEPGFVRYVVHGTHRTLSFDLRTHTKTLKGSGFMGKAWDGSKIAFDPSVWGELLRVAKPGAYLVAFGGTRTYHRLACAIEDAGWELRDCLMWLYGTGFPKSHNLKGEHEGWGTALKPGWEPIILARKPFKGTVAKNVVSYGTGALNIDAARIGTGEDRAAGGSTGKRANADEGYSGAWADADAGRSRPTGGRWPANVAMDPEAGALLGEAARFFYCAKASKKERELGLEDFTPKTVSDGREVEADNAYQRGKTERRNSHPTIKPIELMRWLVRLITPPGGLVCDPFCGSGSTGCAAAAEGFNFLGIEREAEYAALAEARIKHWAEEV